MTTKEKRWIPVLKAAPDSLDADKRTLRAVVSSNSVDRDGEIIEPTAFEEHIGSFLKNPVLLWNHDPRNPPIGKIPGVEFFDDRVEADIQFRSAGEDLLADSVFGLYRQGILTSFSVGFRVLPGGYQEAVEDSETNKIEPPKITKAELFEVSAVAIPANTEAQAKCLELADTLDSGFAAYHKVFGGSVKMGRKFHAAGGQTLYAKPSVLDSLKIAQENLERILDKLTKGQGVDPEELSAMNNLRVLLLAHRAPTDPTGGLAKALEDLASVSKEARSNLSPTPGEE